MTEEEKKLPTEVLDDDFDDEEDDLDLDDLDEDEDETTEEDSDDDITKKGKKEGDEEDSHDDDKDEAKKKEQQDKEERARQAKARREREAREREAREEQIRKEAYLKGKLEGVKVNKFNNEPIKDEYDLFIYETQLKLEEEGKDPEADLPKRLAEINREKAKKASEKASEQQKLNEKIDKEFTEFRGKFPSIKINELLQDPDFKDYADGRLGKGDKTLTQLYESFLKLKEKFSGDKKEEEEDDGKRSAPSPNGGRKQEKTSYSSMTKEEKIKELRRQGLIN